MRIILYSKEEPEGKIFVDPEEYDQALKDGWVEAPWLVDEPKKKRGRKKVDKWQPQEPSQK